MKKIVYFAAPLMVLPFLVGCGNKGTFYKVSVSGASDTHLKFLSEDGKRDISQIKAEKGKDFKFRVEADGDYRVVKEYVMASVGGSILYGNLDFDIKWDGEDIAGGTPDKTKATVTLKKENVYNDILVGGLAGLKDHYMYSLPYLAGLGYTVDGEDPEHPGYVAYNKTLTITFENTAGKSPIDQKKFNILKDGEWEKSVTFTDNKLIVSPDDHVFESYIVIGRSPDVEWLDALSWGQIKEIAASGIAPYLIAVGDTKKITVNDIEHEVRVIGFNHDITTKSTEEVTIKAGITFEFADFITTMNSRRTDVKADQQVYDSTTRRHFDKSHLNEYLNVDVFEMLPDDLKADGMIEEVYKKVGTYDGSKWEATAYTTKLFPLSTSEIGLTVQHAVPNEGSVYDFYKDSGNDKRMKYDATKSGDSDYGHAYWLRSPSTYQPGGFTQKYGYYCGQSGASGYEDVNTAHAMAPCFCI